MPSVCSLLVCPVLVVNSEYNPVNRTAPPYRFSDRMGHTFEGEYCLIISCVCVLTVYYNRPHSVCSSSTKIEGCSSIVLKPILPPEFARRSLASSCAYRSIPHPSDLSDIDTHRLELYSFHDRNTAKLVGITVGVAIAWRILAWAALRARMWRE